MRSEYRFSYIGHFLPEDSEELISIVRTTDFSDYEYWNETKGADLGTTKAFSGHTSTKTLEDHYITPESSAVREAANRAEAALLKEHDRQSKKAI